MAGLIFVSFVGLIFLCFPCTGQISPPLEGSIFYAFPGENVTITWRLVTKLTDLTVRGWTFRTNSKFFAQIFQDEDVKKFPEHSPGLFTIKKPSTLILENVNGTYNGTYKFAISVGLDQYSSVVSVFVVGRAVGVGQISPPLEGSIFYPLPGENVTITWRLGVNVPDLLVRGWTFRTNSKFFARIIDDEDVKKFPEHSPGPFTIKKPSTLILENVNILKYNGTYKFSISVGAAQDSSVVSVFVVVKPNVALNCTSLVTVNEGEEFTCLCEAKGGNPPAEVMWEKDGVPEPDGAGMEQKKLSRNNVKKTDSGIYTCVAKSHTLMSSKSIEVKVNAKPFNTSLKLTPKKVKVGGSFAITCESNGVPEPKYSITHNGTEISTEKMHIIPKVEWRHAGTYKCFVWNNFGNDSDSDTLAVVNTVTNMESDTVVVWHIVVSLLSGIIIGFLLCYIIFYCRRRWFTKGGPQSNPEPQPNEVDPTYQELDLSKLNTEDNYQSLRVNAASNNAASDEDSTYTQLNKTPDVENNYQSLM